MEKRAEYDEFQRSNFSGLRVWTEWNRSKVERVKAVNMNAFSRFFWYFGQLMYGYDSDNDNDNDVSNPFLN